MKKVYTKPQIMFESFALSTAIASCKYEAVFDDSIAGGCQGYFDNAFEQVVFTDAVVGCIFVPPGENDSVCYHNPTDQNNIFSS